jgi:hypothetical protein
MNKDPNMTLDPDNPIIPVYEPLWYWTRAPAIGPPTRELEDYSEQRSNESNHNLTGQI